MSPTFFPLHLTEWNRLSREPVSEAIEPSMAGDSLLRSVWLEPWRSGVTRCKLGGALPLFAGSLMEWPLVFLWSSRK